MAYINQVQKGNIIYEIHDDRVDSKQELLISGENIKTINGRSLLGSGNINVGGGSGGGSDAFTYVINGYMDYDSKEGEITDIWDLSSTQSWTDVENAVENNELIYMDVTLESCEFYLEKETFLEDSDIHSGGSVIIPEKEQDDQQGPYVVMILNQLSGEASGSSNDTFSISVDVAENKSFYETRNRFVINDDAEVLNIEECYFMEDGEKQYLSFTRNGNILYSDDFDVLEKTILPTLHITFSINHYIDYEKILMGYERILEKESFSDYAYINDNHHSGRNINTITPCIISRRREEEDNDRLSISGNLNEMIFIYADEYEIEGHNNELADAIDDIDEHLEELGNMFNYQNIYYYEDTKQLDIRWKDFVDALYYYEEKDGYHRRTDDAAINLYLSIYKNGNIVCKSPAFFDLSNVDLPWSTYSENDIIDVLKNGIIRSQIGTVVYTIKKQKSADINLNSDAPYDYNYYEQLDTSNMVNITTTYDTGTGKWSFNKEFNDIFNDKNKQDGILLTIENSYYASGESIGYHMVDIGGEWVKEPYTFTMPVLLDGNHFVGAYHFEQTYGKDDSQTVEWIAEISIEVSGEMTVTSKDLAAIPTLSIIRGFTTNINGFELQTFTASEQQLDEHGYPYYSIYRRGNPLTYNDAADYMEYMTGSRYVPMFNYQKPLNSLFINSSMQLFKPQFDDNGLKLYVIPTGM